MDEQPPVELPPIAALAEIVPEEKKKNVGKSKLGVREVATILGIDEGAVYRHARELGAKHGPDGRRLVFEMERIRIVQREGLPKKPTAGEAPKHVTDGKRDAKVVSMLEAGKSISEIVVATETALATVIELRRLWLQARAADTEGVVHMCRGCGKASNPVYCFCSGCGPRARALTEEQQAILAASRGTQAAE